MSLSNRAAVVACGGTGMLLASAFGVVAILAPKEHSDAAWKLALGLLAGGLFLAQAFMRTAPEEGKGIRVTLPSPLALALPALSGVSLLPSLAREPSIATTPTEPCAPIEIHSEGGNTAAFARTVAAIDDALATQRSHRSIPRIVLAELDGRPTDGDHPEKKDPAK